MIFSCYKLNENKIMSDGVEIPSDDLLYCLKSEDDILFLLYENQNKDILVFWTRLEDLSYVGDLEKDIDFKIQDIINGDYFNLI